MPTLNELHEEGMLMGKTVVQTIYQERGPYICEYVFSDGSFGLFDVKNNHAVVMSKRNTTDWQLVEEPKPKILWDVKCCVRYDYKRKEYRISAVCPEGIEP